MWSFTLGLDDRPGAIETVAVQTYYRYGIFVDDTCPEGRHILTQSSERFFLNSSYHWLVWGTNENMIKVSKTLNISVDSDFIWSYIDSSTGTIILHDLYKINYSWPVIASPAGKWYTNTGLSYHMNDYKYKRRKNLQGLLFQGGVAILSDMSRENIAEELVKPENRFKDSMATFNYMSFQYLMQQFNFTVNLTVTSAYGYVVDNGRYEGLTKLLGDAVVDIDVSGLYVSHVRYKYMDFTVNTWEFVSGFLFRHPPVTDGLDALIKPFSYSLWICAAFTWICIMALMKLVSWTQYNKSHDQEVTWSDAFLIMMSTVGQQGTAQNFTWLSWRIVFFVLLIVTLLIDTYYASSIVFSLIQEPKRTIRTTRDLLESNLRLGAENVSYNVAYFEVNSDPLIRELFKKKMLKSDSKPEYYSLEEGIKKVLHEPFGFHGELLKMYREIEKTFPEESKCAVTGIVVFTPEYVYIPLRWNSPYKEIIKLGLRRATERGLFSYLRRMLRPPLSACFLPGNEVVSVGIHTVSPAFGIIAIGITIAVIILQIENILRNRSNANISPLEDDHNEN